MEKTILVVGGTGLLGEPVARGLKEAGFNVRILTRNLESARAKFDESYEVAVGDVDDLLAVEKAMEGCWGVHISLSEDKEPDGIRTVVEAAVKKALQRITYTGGALTVEENAGFPPTKNKLDAIEAIKSSGVPYTVFCPAFIMETLELSIQGNRAGVLGTNLPPATMIAAEEWGRLVANGYKSEEAVNKKLFIRGPEAVPLLDALKKYCTALHPEVKKVSAMPFWMANIMAALTKKKELKMMSDVFAFYKKVGECGDPEEGHRILGAPKITFDEWLKKKSQVT